jgi:hypothetical protein
MLLAQKSRRFGLRAAYERQFNSRLRLCSLIRRAAFAPGVADFAIRLFGASDTLRRRVARATRSPAETKLLIGPGV